MESIKSKYIFQELFSFITSKRKFKIIKYNSFLHNKLDLSIIDYKEIFFLICYLFYLLIDYLLLIIILVYSY